MSSGAGRRKPQTLAHIFPHSNETAQALGAFLALVRTLLAVNLSKAHQFLVSSALGNELRPSGCDFSIVAYGRGPVTQQGTARAVR